MSRCCDNPLSLHQMFLHPSPCRSDVNGVGEPGTEWKNAESVNKRLPASRICFINCEWEKICVKLISSLTCPNESPLALLSFSKLGMGYNMFIYGHITAKRFEIELKSSTSTPHNLDIAYKMAPMKCL
eukprot:sb/3475354/